MTRKKLREIAAALIACEIDLGGYRIELMSWAYQLLLDILERKRGEITQAEQYALARMCTIAAGISDLVEEYDRSRRYTDYAGLLAAEFTPEEHNVLWPQLAAHLADCAAKLNSTERCYSKAHKDDGDE